MHCQWDGSCRSYGICKVSPSQQWLMLLQLVDLTWMGIVHLVMNYCGALLCVCWGGGGGMGQGLAQDFGEEGLRLWPKAILKPKGRVP